jgi:hypothetical protein
MSEEPLRDETQPEVLMIREAVRNPKVRASSWKRSITLSAD